MSTLLPLEVGKIKGEMECKPEMKLKRVISLYVGIKAFWSLILILLQSGFALMFIWHLMRYMIIHNISCHCVGDRVGLDRERAKIAEHSQWKSVK